MAYIFLRGMFLNTKAVEQWKSPDYLSSKLGNYTIPIVRNAIVGTLQDDRVLVTRFQCDMVVAAAGR